MAYWNYFISARGEAEYVVLRCITWFFLTVVANSKRDCLVDLAFLLSLQNELWSEHHLVVQLILLFWYPASVEQKDYFAVWHFWKYRVTSSTLWQYSGPVCLWTETEDGNATCYA